MVSSTQVNRGLNLINGNITHIDNRGNLIARSKKAPKEGAKVMDKRRALVGVVALVFGPVERPYLVIRPNKDIGKRMLSLVNEEVFMND
jgi:RNA-binding protein